MTRCLGHGSRGPGTPRAARHVRRSLALCVALLAAATAGGCTVGDGEGAVHSDDLRAGECFRGAFDLEPTFFGSIPYRESQLIRLQHRDDIVENSDGLQVLVLNTDRIRAALGKAQRVGLPPEVTPPGVPIRPDPDPPIVQVTLYLHETCHGRNVALSAVSGTITFAHLFSGDPTEGDAAEKLTEATLDVMVADPRDQPPEGGPVPLDKQSRVTGNFRFYFQRGQPAQPFP